MPPWDEEALEDRMFGLLADLRAAHALALQLPSGSRDRTMVQATIVRLQGDLRRLREEFRASHETPPVIGDP